MKSIVVIIGLMAFAIEASAEDLPWRYEEVLIQPASTESCALVDGMIIGDCSARGEILPELETRFLSCELSNALMRFTTFYYPFSIRIH